MRTTITLAALLALAPAALAKSKAKPAANDLGIDETAIDKTADPCDNFYQYACGNWLKRTEIPADKAAWSRSFNVIDEHNRDDLHKILEGLAAGKLKTDAYGDKLSAFWTSCMDEKQIEANSDADVKALLAPIDAIKNLDELTKVVAELHSTVAMPLFDFRSQQDFKDATQVIASADQGGLGLPDRDYYLKDDARMKEIRAQYLQHVAKMLELAGEPAAQAEKDAQTVMRLETILAQASMSRVDRRDPKKVYHKFKLAGLKRISSAFNWDLYLKLLGHPTIDDVNVATPDFFTRIGIELPKQPIADWKVYLRWHALHGASHALANKFVDESFRFYGKTLQGTDKLEERWKRCVRATDAAMGEALARPFVKETFGADGKSETQKMVQQIEAAMETNLKALSWMDDATRAAAFEKLHAIANKIGFPDKWRNYDSLDVKPGSYMQNVMAANRFESKRDLDKIGKPVDRNEWEMTPPTVNAYYDPSMNEMVFPAGILQPPFFNRQAKAAVNFGAIGMVMGHELTHGFDDEGRQFDAKGNLRDWWSPAVGKEFDQRAQCVVDEYDGFVAVDNEHVNGKLTLGENIADLGGIKLAHAAFRVAYPKPAKLGAYTDDQLFFLGVAQAWCTNRRDAMARVRVKTDPHSPPQFRVNGPLQNLPDFAKAYQCKPGAKMIREKACVVW